MIDEKDSISGFFEEWGLEVTSIDLGVTGKEKRDSRIEISRDSYPGVEPHLVTIADIASWSIGLTPSGDIRLKCPLSGISDGNSLDFYRRYWEQLLTATDTIMGFLEGYRIRFSKGAYPTTLWAHHFMNWAHETWDSRRLEPAPIDSWICYVDPSIRPHIRELNEFGLVTRESCSGNPDDHPDREPYWPYVMFEERTYPGISAHLFTLADMAYWIPIYGRHGFDVSLEMPRNLELSRGTIESYWNNLVLSARKLMPLLQDHLSATRTDSYRNLSNPSLFRLLPGSKSDAASSIEKTRKSRLPQ
ncbi:MAG: hypothetical protein GF309_04530 [Candidatus Lokiarchaeota archaeon]|nr:hypothetical protein [Candidatus Lokiarchaeota archaeon]